MLRCEENLLELNDVRVVAAQPLIKDLPAGCLDAVCTHILSDGQFVPVTDVALPLPVCRCLEVSDEWSDCDRQMKKDTAQHVGL